MNTHYEKIIGFLAGVVVLGLIVWGGVTNFGTKNEVTPPVGTTTGEQVPPTETVQSLSEYLKAPMLSLAATSDWKTYSDTAKGFSIKYPKDFTVNANYINDTNSPGQDQTGVSFTAPDSIGTGTNLRGVQVSVEENPNAAICEAKSFIYSGFVGPNNPQQTVSLNGKTYTFVSATDAAAGNRYEQDIIAIPGSTCRVVRLLIHSTNIGNYDPQDGIKEFDKTPLLSIFVTMAASYQTK